MRILFISTVTIMAFLSSFAAGAEAGGAAKPGVQPMRFIPLPLGAVKPAGWLRNQLIVQANGLTGHLDEVWKDVGPDSAWRGGNGEGWERGPYYLDGLLPLAYLLEDQRLIAKTKPFIDWILTSGAQNGWFGPTKNKDRWPLAVAMKVLTQYQEATGDERALTVLKRYADYLKTAPPDWPDKEWRGVRAGENVLTCLWLYDRTGDKEYLKLGENILANSYDWSKYFVEFPYKEKVPRNMGHNSHVVNIAMATKYPGLRYLLTGEERFRKATYDGIANLDKYHGQVGGRFSGDEHLAGRNPSQGTELCAVVEYMFSLEHLSAVFGDAAFGDRLEMLAYNALPGACTADGWAHQYDQQANQVLVSRAKGPWTTNGNDSNLYGLEPNFGCCTANMHQGWPKFVSHMWMATPDGGLAAVAYGPCRVQADIGGTKVTITEETDYPFDGTIRFTVQADRAVDFPLYLRRPVWRGKMTVETMGWDSVIAGDENYLVIKRKWEPGQRFEVRFPMDLRTETRFNGAVSILRGPLVFSLKIDERFEKLRARHDTLAAADWAISPQSPWNIGLMIDRDKPQAVVAMRKPGAVPFAQVDAPVTLTLKGKVLPQWKLAGSWADTPPASPAATTEPAVDVQLIPYGSARLRISEFPTVAP